MSDAPNWRTSSYTGTENCVEVADNDPSVVRVRDSKRREGPTLDIAPASWQAFTDCIKS
ncbi:DUF397 domain-containing protein [Streptomyces indicus]|uniref:DUF397 domain-containing protein n=1 Tax=Streptomyces indicus TaxID=417292 RepID=A0A1G8W829_9ACTN|nr:DUF397 domain-containing protein [Streptomyces indicus]SDJ74257.1 protein of unknown function [Streptomyces indicus]